MIQYRNFISRSDLVHERDTLFVFGDNLERRGFGGQAREMRGEPNAVGLPTKWVPSMQPSAFLTDDDLPLFLEVISPDVVRLIQHNGIIVWPSAGIGTGLARLAEHAPRIARKLKALRILLE